MSTGYTQFANEMEEGQMGAAPAYTAPDQNKGGQAGYPNQMQQFPPQQVPGTYVYGQVPVQQTMTHISAPPMKDYFGFALFVTLCCCLPLGIVAIMKSSEAKNRAAVGDYAGANLSSAEAKKYSWIGCIIGSVILSVTGIGMAIYIGLVVAACSDGYCE